MARRSESSREWLRSATSATFGQDRWFALRVMVDIANRALSPAVNDPTTAVQVIDHIGEVLTVIGSTDLETRAENTMGRRVLWSCWRHVVGRTS